ncbi:MAG: SHOCT domain-containing protein, partial [Gemmatimonadales bacterium]
GITIALVWLYETMRAVMAIGGSCAEGGPYVVAVPCPHGTAITTLGAIFGGLAMVLVYTAFGLRAGPRVTLLLWSALFLSLGWNFLDFGLRASDSSAATGWLICAVVFALMGGGPVLGMLSPRFAKDLLWSDGVGLPVGLRSGRPATSEPDDRAPAARAMFPAPEPPPPADDLATALTKMAELHARGALTDAEYAEAKRRILED